MSQAGELNVVQNHPEIPTTFIADVGTATPIANELEILGTSIAASGVPVHTTGATNVITVEVQRASAQASSSAANAGIASFDNAHFGVDSNGFVTFTGTGATETLTGNTGGAVGPTANNINILGSGGVTVSGNPGTSTLTIVSTGVVKWNLISASQTLAVNMGYFCTGGGALALALPATSAVGDIIEVSLQGSTSWSITQSAGQQLKMGNLSTTAGVGGSLTSTQQGDSIRMVCLTANLTWVVFPSMGNPTIV